MGIQAISTIKPQNKNNHFISAAAIGAAAGAGSRYVIPTSKEMGDKFFSSAKMNARGAERSILKFGGIGALIAVGINAIFKGINKDFDKTSIEYTKYGALLDAPDYACEIMWFNDELKNE